MNVMLLMLPVAYILTWFKNPLVHFGYADGTAAQETFHGSTLLHFLFYTKLAVSHFSIFSHSFLISLYCPNLSELCIGS